MTPTHEKLLASLKRHAPAKVIAYTSDDESQAIAVPGKRKRWAQVLAALESRSWTRVELLDKSSALICTIDNVEPARELEELAIGGNAVELRLAERIVALVLKGQRDTMSFRDAEVTNLLRAQGDVMREMSNGMHSLTALYREQIGAARELATIQTEAKHAGGDGSVKELMDALPTILQALPMLRALLQGPPASAPNGTKTATPK